MHRRLRFGGRWARLQRQRAKTKQATKVCFSKSSYRGLIDNLGNEPAVLIQRAFADIHRSDAAFRSAKSSSDGEIEKMLVQLINRGVAQQYLVAGKLHSPWVRTGIKIERRKCTCRMSLHILQSSGAYTESAAGKKKDSKVKQTNTRRIRSCCIVGDIASELLSASFRFGFQKPRRLSLDDFESSSSSSSFLQVEKSVPPGIWNHIHWI